METFTKEFDAVPANIGPARTFVVDLLANHPRVDDARLLVSELATNAVRHGDHTTFTVTVVFDAVDVRVTVFNTGGGRLPEAIAYSQGDAENGRGLAFLRDFAPAWGYAQESQRTRVWFDFPASLPAAA